MAGRTRTIFLLLLLPLILIPFILQQAFPKKEKITIAIAKQPAFALLYIADKKGFFTDEGLDVTFREYDLGKDALTDVLNGNAHLATVFETPLVHRIYEGKQLRVITSLHTSNKNTALIIRTTDGITSVQDLRGKIIGVNKGTNSELFLSLLLKTEGIDSRDVIIQDIPADQITTALEDGSIQAAALFNPHLYIAQRTLAAEEQKTIFSTVYTEFSTLTGTAAFVENNGATVEKVLRALRKAELFAEENKKEAIAITDARLPLYDVQTITNTWDATTHTLTLNNKMLSVMEQEAEILHDDGIYTDVMPNFRLSFEINHLKQVNPEAVTIY